MKKLIKNKELVRAPGGKFIMGDNQGLAGERPEHEVLVKEFYITPYPITVEEYCEFLNDVGRIEIKKLKEWIAIPHSQIDTNISNDRMLKAASPKKGKKLEPVVDVSWYGANAFCEWAGGELPTEEQWEYVAKWGPGKQHGNTEYPLGNKFNSKDYCFNKNSIEEVGNYPPNGIGVHDIGGLVWEWCQDEYDPDAYKKKVEKSVVAKDQDKKPMVSSTKLIVDEGRYIVVEIDGEPVVIRK